MRSEPPTPKGQQKDTPKPPPIPVDRPDPTPTLGMTEKLDVDLRTDPRKDFEVHGPVEYTMGRLTLGPAGSVRRVLDVGSQARLTLNLEFTPLREDDQTSTTRFAFQIRDRGEFVVLIVRRREKSKTLGELRLIDQDTPYGGRTARTLEKATRTLAAEWSIRMMPARPGKNKGDHAPQSGLCNSLLCFAAPRLDFTTNRVRVPQRGFVDQILVSLSGSKPVQR